MHQPYYKDPFTGLYRLPWVRLHGTKDYLDMVEILKDFPLIRQNFNLVPSLVEQIMDYSENGAQDVFLEVSHKKASELSQDDKIFILENFFLANWENMIKPFPRYYDLLNKRGTRIVKGDLNRLINYFTEGDFRDLQVLFNLCWIDPLFRSQDPLFEYLSRKGKNYSEEDKKILLEKQLDILHRIIPAYKEMVNTGRIELSFSPFYHPILPLLCNTDISRVAIPDIKLPRKRFSHPEDAEKQIESGLRYFEQIFGYRPVGMWPSEGSVSEEALRLAARYDIKWVATDEGVLSESLRKRLRDDSGNPLDYRQLYRPYNYNGMSVIFRDRILSDLIGFSYSRWDPKAAAADLVSRLLRIRNSVPKGSPHLVPIILDGENAWEYFRNDGRDFFRFLYEGLSREDRLKTITVADYIREHDSGEKLDYLHPGSWINANFRIWIGHEEDNRAWDYLTETRDTLDRFHLNNPAFEVEKAFKALYVAEGSDWNWWYGDEHTTETQEEFDELFRLNLMKVYKEIGQDIPSHLFVPVLRQDRSVIPTSEIRGFIEPIIDGIVTGYYEWYQAAHIDAEKSGGSMHKSEGLISTVYFGFNRDNLFLRLDPKIPFDKFDAGMELVVTITGPSEMRISCPIRGTDLKGEIFEKSAAGWEKKHDIAMVALHDVFEIGIPFRDLNAKEKDEIHLSVSITKGADEFERCPWRGNISITVPTENYEAMMWM